MCAFNSKSSCHHPKVTLPQNHLNPVQFAQAINDARVSFQYGPSLRGNTSLFLTGSVARNTTIVEVLEDSCDQNFTPGQVDMNIGALAATIGNVDCFVHYFELAL